MRRCLIVANQTLAGPHLAAEILVRQAQGDCEFHVLVPATHAQGSSLWTEGEAIAHARGVLAEALERLREDGIDATGEVGDENPVLAVGDVLNRWTVDEIIVSTLPPGASKWLKRDLPRRLARRFAVPVTHIVATSVQVS
jgi:hypothetical protein